MNAMLEARMVAANTQRPVACEQGEMATRELIAASSQGGFIRGFDVRRSPQAPLVERISRDVDAVVTSVHGPILIAGQKAA
jgi:hypothetical protein